MSSGRRRRSRRGRSYGRNLTSWRFPRTRTTATASWTATTITTRPRSRTAHSALLQTALTHKRTITTSIPNDTGPAVRSKPAALRLLHGRFSWKTHSVDLHGLILSMKMKYFSYVSLFLDVECRHFITWLADRCFPSYAIIVDITAICSGGGSREQCSYSEMNPVLFRIRQH